MMKSLFRTVAVTALLYLTSAAGADPLDTLDSLLERCENQQGGPCVDGLWPFIDISGDERLSIAELTRFFRLAGKWRVVQSAGTGAAGDQAAAASQLESNRLGAVAAGVLAGPFAARILIDNFDYNGDGTVERAEVFADMDESAFVAMIKRQAQKLPTHAMALLGWALDAQQQLDLGGIAASGEAGEAAPTGDAPDVAAVTGTAGEETTWAPQTSGTDRALYSVHFAADAKTGWAVGGESFGDGGTIVATSDGGKTWAPQTSGTDRILYSVHFAADATTGWAVGDNGTIVATSDGGKTWVHQTSGTDKNLLSVHFAADAKTGWAVGDDGTIIATSDGGKTWVHQTSGTDMNLESVHFATDAMTGWAVGLATLVATSDGGKTWALRTNGPEDWLKSVHFATDAKTGWAVGGSFSGKIVATSDGGTTWAPQTSGTKAQLYSVHFAADAKTGWAVGKDGTIVATSD